MADPKKKKKVRKKEKKVLPIRGIAHVRSTFNNTVISITDGNGGVVAWASCGKMGYKGSRKGTPFAAQLAAESCAREVMSQGMKKVEVWVKGPGSGREAAIRSLQAAGLEISGIKDVTLTPHNGCRMSKRRRT
jgi:small subunit ribosomal protein S11